MENRYLYLFVIALVVYWFFTARKRREKYLEKYVFPKELETALSKEFKSEQHEQILEALREYFIILNKANNAKFFVPSKAILIAWRIFIDLESYEKFANKAFGEVIVPPKLNKKISKWTLRNAFRTVYALASSREKIDRKKQKKLPSIFKLDKLLNIKNGTKFEFKKGKSKKSKRKIENEGNGVSFSLSYSSDEYWECSLESDFISFSMSSESSMDEYNDNVSDASSDSNSSSSPNLSSSSSDFESSSSSSSSSDSGGSSD
jgi:hypothetical protein